MKPNDCVAAAFLVILTVPVEADTFGTGANTFIIDFVTIGNPGNPDRVTDRGSYGGVPYVFKMGVTETPRDWVTKAKNLGLANVPFTGSWTGNEPPASELTWFQAAAFVNWLNTSTGHTIAYQLNATNTALTLWSSAQAWQAGGENLFRNKDAYYFLPSEDEWLKAAYHKNDGVTGNYWNYATGSDSPPLSVRSGTAAGTAVYELPSGVQFPAGVNDNGGLSPYGTRGQNGNLWEWQELATSGINPNFPDNRVIQGGVYDGVLGKLVLAQGLPASSGGPAIGFRVASIPEPSSTVCMMTAALLALSRRCRQTRAEHSLRATKAAP